MNYPEASGDGHSLVSLTYLVSLAFPLLATGGILLSRRKAVSDSSFLPDHIRYQTITALMSALALAVALALPGKLAGFLILLAAGLWWTRRTLRGLLSLVCESSPPNDRIDQTAKRLHAATVASRPKPLYWKGGKRHKAEPAE